jgi:hypothetical protein
MIANENKLIPRIQKNVIHHDYHRKLNYMESQFDYSNVVGIALQGIGNISKEVMQLTGIGLNKYVEGQIDKYYYIAPVFHTQEKKVFKDIYFPLEIVYGKYSTDFSDVSDVISSFRYITIIGTAGSGKSTILKHILLSTFVNPFKVPILIELRSFNTFEFPFESFISEVILTLNIAQSAAILDRAYSNGDFLFLLDGYDEIQGTNRQKKIDEIDRFIDKFSKNYFIITGRPGSSVERKHRFTDFRVSPLHKRDQIDKFIDLSIENEERKINIKLAISNSTGYVEYLSNPLLLSMFILAFESHPEIPKLKTAFYKNVFDTLYSRHDGITKGSFVRERRTKLERQNFEKILRVFSIRSWFEGVFEFNKGYLTDKLNPEKFPDYHYNIDDLLYDFTTSISILIVDEWIYTFPHRSLQEYFAACFITELSEPHRSKLYARLKDRIESNRDSNILYLVHEIDKVAVYETILLPSLKKMLVIFNSEYDFYDFISAYNFFISFIFSSGKWVITNISMTPNYTNTYFAILKIDLLSIIQHPFLLNSHQLISGLIKLNLTSEHIELNKLLKNNGYDEIQVLLNEIRINLSTSIEEKINLMEKEIRNNNDNLNDIISGL